MPHIILLRVTRDAQLRRTGESLDRLYTRVLATCRRPVKLTREFHSQSGVYGTHLIIQHENHVPTRVLVVECQVPLNDSVKTHT